MRFIRRGAPALAALVLAAAAMAEAAATPLTTTPRAGAATTATPSPASITPPALLKRAIGGRLSARDAGYLDALRRALEEEERRRRWATKWGKVQGQSLNPSETIETW
jgi:phosphate-selective porin